MRKDSRIVMNSEEFKKKLLFQSGKNLGCPVFGIQGNMEIKTKSNNSYNSYPRDRSKAVIINGIHEFNIYKVKGRWENDCFSNSWATIAEMKKWIATRKW